MCGIVGIAGRADSVDAVLAGLRRLEYRGYDSGGIAALNGTGVVVRKLAGRLDVLAQSLEEQPLQGSVAIGHTRWATHGAPSDANAHPHTGAAGRIAVVHNGIIENHDELRASLRASGVVFSSETDTEVLAHLIAAEIDEGGDLATAVRRALRRVRGAYAIAAIREEEPGTIVAARQDSPLVVGFGDENGTAYVASDVCALLEHTRRVHYLADGEIAIARDGEIEVIDLDGNPVAVEPVTIEWSLEDAETGGYSHFMLKEIHEQPQAVRATLRERVDPATGRVDILEEIGLDEETIRGLERIVVIACGTSWHAGLVGKFLIEEMARLPVDVEIASEYRYREHFADEHTLLLPISQSGETADTLAALRAVRDETGAPSLGIVNVVGSAIARETDGVLFTRAGPEIGVASSKAFTTQLAALSLLAIQFGRVRGILDDAEADRRGLALADAPSLVERTLERADEYLAIAGRFAAAHDFLYLGRGLNFPIALEGALKLKEISYVHAEGYPAGEMKHGPIALIDANMPVVAIATDGRLREKVLSNVQEAAARGAQVIAVENEDRPLEGVKVSGRLDIPACEEFLSPMLAVIPLQLLAFRIAQIRGCDIDKPRNLAKSVTVE